jgi:hypothetical protein
MSNTRGGSGGCTPAAGGGATVALGAPALRSPPGNPCQSRSGQRLSGFTLGTKPDTRTPNPKYPDPDPKYPNPHYPISCSDSKSYYPNLYRVIRVVTPGTRKTQIGICIRLLAIKCNSKLVKFLVALLGFASQLTHLFTSVFVSLTPRDFEFPCEAQARL